MLDGKKLGRYGRKDKFLGLYGVTSIVLEITDIKVDDLNMTEEKNGCTHINIA